MNYNGGNCYYYSQRVLTKQRKMAAMNIMNKYTCNSFDTAYAQNNIFKNRNENILAILKPIREI